VALRDLFGEDGLLRDAPLDEVDGGPIAVPWPATSDEVQAVLGSASESRRRVYAHLAGFLDWFQHALASDRRREVWLRGEFAATLQPEVADLISSSTTTVSC